MGGQLTHMEQAAATARKQIMLYVQVMQNDWSYATKYMKELENKEMGLPEIPIQVAPQTVYQNRGG